LADSVEIDRLLDAGVGRQVDRSGLIGAPRPALTRRLVRRVVPAAALVLLAFVLTDAWVWRLSIPAVLIGIAAISGVDAYRNLGHRLDGDVLVTRVGSLLRRTVVVLVPRIQSLRDSSSPFQRLRGLATLRVDLAGRGIPPAVVDQHRERCAELDAGVRAVLAPSGSGSAGLGVPAPIRETGPPVPLPNPTNEEP
jgi:putative membrane protein